MTAPSQPLPNRSVWLWVSSGFLLQAIPAAIRDEALPAALKNLQVADGLNTRVVAILGLLVGIKILWAPLISRLGTQKRVILIAQTLMILLLFATAEILGGIQGRGPHVTEWIGLYVTVPLALISLLSAGHDFALDGYYVASLDHESRSRYAGLLNFASKLGQVLAGPGLIWIAGKSIAQGRDPYYAWSDALLYATGLTLIVHLLVRLGFRREPPAPITPTPDLLHILKELIRDSRFPATVALIFFYRTSEIHMSLVAKLFSLAKHDSGGLALSNETYAVLRLTTAISGLALGGLLGSQLITRYGLQRTLLPLGIVMHLPLLGIAWLAQHTDASLPTITSLFFIEYLVYGTGLCAILLAMMQLAAGSHAAIRYAALSTLGLLAAYLPGLWAGALSTHFGYQNYFLGIILLAIPGILAAHVAKKHFV